MVEFDAEDYQFNSDESSSENESLIDDEPTSAPAKKRARNNEDGDVLQPGKKKPKNDLYKQPTPEEMTQLRETQNLFNSNIFRLQITELLNEIKTKSSYEAHFTSWFSEFQSKTLQIPELQEEFTNQKKMRKPQKGEVVSDNYELIKYCLKNTKLPVKQHVSMKFLKPKSVQMQGHLKNMPTPKTKFVMDVIITMSKGMFFEKDFLNMKYFTKKQYYMSYIMYYMQQFQNVTGVTLKSYLHNEYLNYLEVIPTFSNQVLINVFIVPENGVFPAKRFLPERNNIKDLSFIRFPDFKLEPYLEQGTLLYNSLILFDVTLEETQKLQEEALNYENIKDGIKLLMIWLFHRKLNTCFWSFTNDMLIHVIHYLVSKRKINKLMSSYQVVRIFWAFFSGLKGDEKLSIAVDVKPNDLQKFPGFTLLDSSGCYNVAAFLDANIFARIKSDAKKALDALDSNRFNTFAHLFTTEMPTELQYDALLCIKDGKKFKKIYEKCNDDDRFKYFGFHDLLIRNFIEKVLKYGLSSRISELVPLVTTDEASIMYGVNFDQDNCYNVIEKGPKQYEVGAEEFKAFWGKLAELRRFKDSSIYEAVYFDKVKTVQDKRLIVNHIIEFVMTEKLHLDYQLHGAEMEQILKLRHLKYPCGSSEDAILKIKAVQTSFEKILRNLQMPLAITGVQCTSDIYSYTELFPPLTSTQKGAANDESYIAINPSQGSNAHLPPLIQPIECVLQLALNSKWPRTLHALRAMKTIYYFEMSKLLRSEHGVHAIAVADYLDVFFSGYVFRLRIHHPKEIALVKKDVSADGVTFYKDTPESLALERELDVLPRLAGALNGLHQAHPSFGPSTCLIKRWLRSQLLDAGHICDVVVSLLNASLFLAEAPYRGAVLPQVAFLRFLKFVAHLDPEFHTVCANFNDGLTAEQLADIDSKFLQSRHSYNALHIVTPFDEGRSIFTKSGPSNLVLKRIRALAREMYTKLISRMQPGNALTYKDFFIPNLTGYDLLIKLKPSVNVRKYQQLDSRGIQFDEYDDTENTSFPIVGFEPIQIYLNELRKNYGEYALFFHDTYGGETIGVLWKPNISKQQEFKISQTHACSLTTHKKLTVNIDALIQDFYIHGKGIVKLIEIQQK